MSTKTISLRTNIYANLYSKLKWIKGKLSSRKPASMNLFNKPTDSCSTVHWDNLSYDVQQYRYTRDLR
jgi:hypothetical protein